jgi:hypothetical protein
MTKAHACGQEQPENRGTPLLQHIIPFLGLGVPTSHAAKVLASGSIIGRVHSFREVLIWLPVDQGEERGIDGLRSVGFADVKFLNELVIVV